jgi:hypothetical protein
METRYLYWTLIGPSFAVHCITDWSRGSTGCCRTDMYTTGAAHAAAEEARPEAAEQTLPEASQATNCQILSYLVRGRGTVKKIFFFSLLNFGFFALFRFVPVFIETPKLALFESNLILKDLRVLLNICIF